MACMAISPAFSDTWFAGHFSGILSVPTILLMVLPRHSKSIFRLACFLVVMYMVLLMLQLGFFGIFTLQEDRMGRQHLPMSQSSGTVDEYWAVMILCSSAPSPGLSKVFGVSVVYGRRRNTSR